MIINISGTEFELNFGWDFIRTMNKINGIDINGMSMDTGGVVKLMSQLSMGDPDAVIKAIQGGTSTEKSKPSVAEIEDYVMHLIENGGYQDFLDELKEQLNTQPLTRVAMNQETASNQTDLTVIEE